MQYLYHNMHLISMPALGPQGKTPGKNGVPSGNEGTRDQKFSLKRIITRLTTKDKVELERASLFQPPLALRHARIAHWK